MSKHSTFYLVLLFLVTFCLYIFFAGRWRFEFPVHPANYFSHFAYSLINGRIDLISSNWDHDLTIWQGKKYMYWGPSPVILILPFIKIFGVNFSDAFYTAVIASLTPLIFYLTLEELNKLKVIVINNFKKFLLSMFLAFGTVYFVISVNGGVWFTSQAISTLYIFTAIFFIFRFKRLKNLRDLIIATIFLNLSILGRISFILYLPFFITVIVSLKNNLTDYFYNLKFYLLVFFTICLLFFSIFAAYNYIRFGSILENGLSTQNLALTFRENEGKHGVLNISYVPINFHYMILNIPLLTKEYPYLKFDYMGNSFFATSPLFLLLFLIVKKRYWQNQGLVLFNGASLLTITSITIFLLFYFGTGYLQFGYRYMLDAIPLLLILLGEVIEEAPLPVIITLFLFSLAINTLGVMWFLRILPL